MNSKFLLNDRQNSNQLSDKIIGSGEDLFQVYLSSNVIQQILMKFELTHSNKEMAYRRTKDVVEYLDHVAVCFPKLKDLTDDPNEKVFFDMCVEGLYSKGSEFYKQMEKLFGKPDPKLMAGPESQPAFCLETFNLYNISNGPFLRGLVPFVASLLTFARVPVYLKENPNYLDNELAEIITFKEWGLKAIVDRFRDMIDCRADQVSDKELEVLCELFRRDLAIEIHIQKHEFSQLKWFEP